MANTITSFTPQMLHTYEGVRRALDCRHSIAKIANHAGSAPSELKPFIPDDIKVCKLLENAPKLQKCKWLVAECATAPFRWLLRLVLFFIKQSLHLINGGMSCLKVGDRYKIKTLCRKLDNVDDWVNHGLFFSMINPQTKCYRISNAINRPHRKAKHFLKWNTIEESQIADARVRAHLYENKIKFDHFNGICRGMSFSFLRYFFETRELFASPRAQMEAIGQRMCRGGKVEAVFNQSIDIRYGEIIDFVFDINRNYFSEERDPQRIWNGLTWKFWNENPTTMQNTIAQVPPGAYYLGIPYHGMAYIKISDQLSYLFDANDGIIEINGVDQAEYLYQLVTQKAKAIQDEQQAKAVQDEQQEPIENMNMYLQRWQLRNDPPNN